jgi:hypothetical protein
MSVVAQAGRVSAVSSAIGSSTWRKGTSSSFVWRHHSGESRPRKVVLAAKKGSKNKRQGR